MRRSTREADDPNVPEWPEERACPDCGKACWAVDDESGTELLLDAQPMETELVTELYGEVRRVRAVSSYVHPGAFAVSGWRLLDPVQVIGEGWFWYANRVRLSVEDNRTLYSEHVYTCKRVSPKVVEGLLSVVTYSGGAAADIYGTRAKKVALRERREADEAWMRAGNSAPLPSEVGAEGLEAAEQLPLFC